MPAPALVDVRFLQSLEDTVMLDDREQAIRERAYAIWEQQGCPEGLSIDHWLRAEEEITTDEALGIRHEGKLEPALPNGPQDLEC